MKTLLCAAKFTDFLKLTPKNILYLISRNMQLFENRKKVLNHSTLHVVYTWFFFTILVPCNILRDFSGCSRLIFYYSFHQFSNAVLQTVLLQKLTKLWRKECEKLEKMAFLHDLYSLKHIRRFLGCSHPIFIFYIIRFVFSSVFKPVLLQKLEKILIVKRVQKVENDGRGEGGMMHRAEQEVEESSSDPSDRGPRETIYN